MKHQTTIRKLVFSAICLSLSLVLPFLTGHIPQIGAMLCPMHIPVLLCGFLCGWYWGLAVGAVAPLLRFALFGMPPLMPTGIAMAFELATYGAVSGLLYRTFPRQKGYIYASLLLAMIAGRLVWGGVRFCFAGLTASAFPFSLFLSGAVLEAIPGIIVQLVLIPLLVMALRKAGLTD